MGAFNMLSWFEGELFFGLAPTFGVRHRFDDSDDYETRLIIVPVALVGGDLAGSQIEIPELVAAATPRASNAVPVPGPATDNGSTNFSQCISLTSNSRF